MDLTLFPPSSVDITLVRPRLLAFEVRVEDDRLVLDLGGEADLSTRAVLCEAFSRVIAHRGGGDVVVDLAGLSFIDVSTGRVFAIAHQLLERNGRRLALRRPSTLVQRVLATFGMTDLIEVRAAPR
jgi:anti-anti-sigma factor